MALISVFSLIQKIVEKETHIDVDAFHVVDDGLIAVLPGHVAEEFLIVLVPFD